MHTIFKLILLFHVTAGYGELVLLYSISPIASYGSIAWHIRYGPAHTLYTILNLDPSYVT